MAVKDAVIWEIMIHMQSMKDKVGLLTEIPGKVRPPANLANQPARIMREAEEVQDIVRTEETAAQVVERAGHPTVKMGKTAPR